MGVRSYVPQIGRFLQPDPVAGGSANAYDYTFQDPVDTTDPSGEYTYVASYVSGGLAVWAAGAEGREAVRVAERRAAEEAAARAAAEYAAEEAAAAAEWAAFYAEMEESSAEFGEEWGEEEVSFHPGRDEQASPLVEEGLMFGPTVEPEHGRLQQLICVAHSAASGHPCIRYVNIFGEIVGDVKAGWKFIKNQGAKAVHTAVKVINLIRRKECEEYTKVGCGGIGNTASTCQAVGFGLMFSAFGAWDVAYSKGLAVIGAADYNNC